MRLKLMRLHPLHIFADLHYLMHIHHVMSQAAFFN